MLHCSKCGGTGLIMRDNDALRCSCVKEKTLDNNYLRSGLTPLMQKCTFENFDFRFYPENKHDEVKGISYAQTAKLTHGASREFVQRFLKNPNTQGLLFTGPVGSGKTYLACCIANSIIKSGGRVMFVVVPDWLDEIRSTYDQNTKTEFTERNILDAAREIPLLILDDLGVHNYTEWTKNKLYSIINHRLNHQMATIITTNLSVAELSEHLGDRTTSRLFQMCKFYRLLVDTNIRYAQCIK